MRQGFLGAVRALAGWAIRDPHGFWTHRVAIPIRWKLHQRMRRTSSARFGRSRLEKQGVLDLVEAFLSGRPEEAFGPDYFDLWHLYRDLRSLGPDLAIEFGSGVSTVVLGAALLHNGRGRLLSFESDPGWFEATRANLPGALRDVVSIEYRPPKLGNLPDGTLAWHYADKPAVGPIGFVYVDGPPGTDETVVSSDPVEIEPQLAPEARLVFDGRTATKEAFFRNCRHRYRDRYRSWWSNDSVVDRLS